MVITGSGIRQWPLGQGDISSGRIALMRYIWCHACASKGCETLEVSRIFFLERLFGPGMDNGVSTAPTFRLPPSTPSEMVHGYTI